MVSDTRPAEVFPPGDVIKEELEARDWSQAELAEIMGRSPVEISDLILGKRAVSAQLAGELGAALGTSAQFWLNLETSYRLGSQGAPDDAIARRAALRELAPISEMVKRHWLEASGDIAVLEERVKRYFEIAALDQPPRLPHAARGAREGRPGITQAQLAWLFRAKQLAPAVQAAPFSARSFARGLKELKGLLQSTPDVRHVPRVLAEAGVRLLVIEQLPKTRIDGVTFWLRRSPVIALSMRYDRIDYFWHTLAHELGHVSRRDAWLLDTDMFGEDAVVPDEDAEREADLFATDFLVSRQDLDDFISRTRPLFGKGGVTGFAARMGVHPGIVVGQLQFRHEVPWSHFRAMLDKVRHIITESALTDGWGRVPPVGAD